MVRFVCASIILVWFSIPDQAGAQLLFFGRKQPVKTVSTEQVYELFKRQVSAGKEKALGENEEKPAMEFVLVDVRSEKEQAVSMIPGAITAQQYTEHRKRYQGQTVIAYCTVGVRSEHFARKLIVSGQAALNFKASILGWCEAKLPLVTPEGNPTKRVHTYSSQYKVPREYTAVY